MCPLYQYQCQDCQETFDELWTTFQEVEEFEAKYIEETPCPKCSSKKKCRLMSAPMVSFKGEGWTGKGSIGPTGSQSRHRDSTGSLKEHAARIKEETKNLTTKDLYGDI